MDKYADKSCWGITAWAVAIFCVVLVIAMMFSEVDAGAALAASTGR